MTIDIDNEHLRTIADAIIPTASSGIVEARARGWIVSALQSCAVTHRQQGEPITAILGEVIEHVQHAAVNPSDHLAQIGQVIALRALHYYRHHRAAEEAEEVRDAG